MALNTSCSVTNSRLGPLSLMSATFMPCWMPMATAAGITARPAIRATRVSEKTMTTEFFTRFSCLLR